MKLDQDVVGDRRTTTPNSVKASAAHADRPRAFDVMVSTMLVALLVAAIELDYPSSGEIGGTSADRQSYFALAVDFVLNFGLSIGLTWLLFAGRPHEDNKGTRP
jgi:hypothetical protein